VYREKWNANKMLEKWNARKKERSNLSSSVRASRMLVPVVLSDISSARISKKVEGDKH